jgi:hypothetical protein
MAWSLGSESRETSGTNTVPAGTGHAVDPADGRTACGRPLRSLHLWPDIPWRRVGMIGLAQCPVCEAQAER